MEVVARFILLSVLQSVFTHNVHATFAFTSRVANRWVDAHLIKICAVANAHHVRPLSIPRGALVQHISVTDPEARRLKIKASPPWLISVLTISA